MDLHITKYKNISSTVIFKIFIVYTYNLTSK